MANVVKRENMVISIREYTDNQRNQKKVWKTIGELITWDDGNQSFEQWGSGGLVKGSIFEQQQNNNQAHQQGGFNQQQRTNPNAPMGSNANQHLGQQQGGFNQPQPLPTMAQQEAQQQGGFDTDVPF